MLSIKSIGTVTRKYRNIMRYRQIITIIIKYGFGNIIEALKIEQVIESGLQLIPGHKPEKIEKLSGYQRIRMALEELGPTFIKMGQVLSSRPDLVPVGLLQELSKLQDEVPPFEFEHVKSIMATEFAKPCSEMFDHFEKIPFASASIGQVHKAVLKGNKDIAVKIQRPGIRKTIEVDLEIMHHLATLMQTHIEELAPHRPALIVEEFAKTLEKELDYTIEATSMERMARQFASDHTLHIPKVYRDESSERVLTMEFINGIKISEINAIDSAGLNRKLLTKRGADFIMKQIFEFGFFHADPHPGNILVTKNNVICPLDYGMTGFVDKKTREIFVDLIHSIASRNYALTARLLCDLTGFEDQPDLSRLEKSIAVFVDLHLTKSLKQLKTSKMVHHFLELCAEYHLRIPPDFFLMIKAFVAIEGVAKKLDPDFDMLRHAVPYVKAAKFSRISPSRLAADVMDIARESFRLIQIAPGDIIELMRLAKKGKLELNINIGGLDKVLANHHQTSNRIAFSIIIAALILGSTQLIRSDVPPMVFGVSFIGIVGFMAAAIMGVWLLVAIIKKGRL